jgi:TPR repeat protein
MTDAADECAKVAASNAEAGVTSFVVRDELRPSVALDACRVAVGKNPNDLKARYRLSRAQYADNDKKAAFESARIAAEGGYGPAIYNLAMFYWNGDGTDKDRGKTVTWLVKLIDHEKEVTPQFLAQAYWLLAENYAHGMATAKNVPEAIKWYSRAAALNHPDAGAQLGYYYQTGTGVAKDEKRGADYTLRAAKAGSCTAAFNAGVIYYNGFGIPVNKRESKHWYQKAKECPTSTEDHKKSSDQMIARINKEATPHELSTGEKLAIGAGAVIGGVLLYNKLKGPETAAIYLGNECQDPARFTVRYFDQQWKFASLNLKPGEEGYVIDNAGKKIAHEVDHKLFTSGYGLQGKYKWGGKLPFKATNGTLYMGEQKNFKRDKDGDLSITFTCKNKDMDDDEFPY